MRTQALDRTQGKLRKGTTPLKVRPVIVKDLSMFGTPRSQKRKKSRIRRVLAPDDELEMSARSNHSRRSSKSVRRLSKGFLKRSQTSTMGHRKSRKTALELTQKRASKSRSKSARKHKKSIKRRYSEGSEEVINRLSQPVDHTETKKRIEREL